MIRILRLKTEIRGFSLVEVILYIAIASLIFGAVASFVVLMFDARGRSAAVREVEAQGAFAAETVTRHVRNAETLFTPQKGEADAVLLVGIGQDPEIQVLFWENEGVVKMKEVGGASFALSNARVRSSDLLFENLSRKGAPDAVHFRFTLSYAGPAGKKEREYSKTFYGSAALRK